MKQKSIPVGCVPPAFLSLGDLPTETPPNRDPLPRQKPPRRNIGTLGNEQRLLEGIWDQGARQEVTSYRDPMDRQTPVKILPCPKLHLREINNINHWKNNHWKKNKIKSKNQSINFLYLEIQPKVQMFFLICTET